MMEQRNKENPCVEGTVHAHAQLCVCVYIYISALGGLSVSEVAVSPPMLSLITPLTPQEALDVRLAS